MNYNYTFLLNSMKTTFRFFRFTSTRPTSFNVYDRQARSRKKRKGQAVSYR